jgi:hypothetical protein
MSGSAKQRFHGITRAIFARLRKKASQLGIRVASPRGQAEKDGVKIEWDYDASAQVLEVETKAPFWINAAVVNRTLRREIEVTCRSSRRAA